MKKKRFENMGTIFSFTFRQGAKGGMFVFITYVVPVLLFLLFFAINVFMAMDKDEQEPSSVQTVYVVDDTGLDLLGEVMIEAMDPERFPDMKISTVTGSTPEEVLQGISQEDTASFVLQAQELEDAEKGTCFQITAILPEQCTVSEEEYEEVLSLAVSGMEAIKVSTAGISMEALNYLNSYVQAEVVQAGEQPQTLADVLVKMLAPMIFTLLLYMMLLLYGQSIGKVVVAEKASKLMEMVLTSVHADALIAGKVLAMTSLALLQIFLWILGGVLGFVAGDFVAGQMNPDYTNMVMDMLQMVTGENGAAFSAPAVILSLLSICIGFLFYCVLAGLIASTVGKPEDVAKGMGTYNLFVVIGFFASYFIVMMENRTFSRIIRFIPFSAAFALPPDILVGNAGLLEGGLCLGLLTVCTVILIMITAKIYRDKVFYNGTNLLAVGKRLLTGKRQ